MTEYMGNLFEDEDQADCSQQALDHTQREERRDKTHAENAQQYLDQARNEDGCQEDFEAAEKGDLCCDNGSQTGRWSAHTFVGTADQANQNSAYDS